MDVLREDCTVLLPRMDAENFQMIYLDPPFFTQKTHSLCTRDNSKEYSFKDRWTSLQDYLSFMKEVLVQCKRILKTTGSIFLHCDKSASHYLRVLLDEVFGVNNFQSEIIWAYKRWSNSKKGLLNNHQTIYFYTKSSDFKFNTIYTDYSPTTNIDQILQARVRNESGKSAYRRDKNGNIVLGEAKKGVPLSDVWNIPFLNPKAKERAGYPTQKPILLLEQIIQISTDKGDKILDPFCGSGTTMVASKLLERDSIGIDISYDAVKLTKKRLTDLVKTESDIVRSGKENFLEKSDYERTILRAIDAVPVERNNGIDGFLRYYVDGKPVAVKIQKRSEDIETAKEKLIKAGQSKSCHFMVLIRTNRLCQSLFAFKCQESAGILIIDAYDLLIDEWLNKHSTSQKQGTIFPETELEGG